MSKTRCLELAISANLSLVCQANSGIGDNFCLKETVLSLKIFTKFNTPYLFYCAFNIIRLVLYVNVIIRFNNKKAPPALARLLYVRYPIYFEELF